MDHHAVCEYNLRKLLLNGGFVLVECRCQRWDPETIKLILFAILFTLNILCDVVNDAIDKHVRRI